jgi:hypothetical protein
LIRFDIGARGDKVVVLIRIEFGAQISIASITKPTGWHNYRQLYYCKCTVEQQTVSCGEIDRNDVGKTIRELGPSTVHKKVEARSSEL